MRIEPKNATLPRVPPYPYSFPNEMASTAVSSAAIAATIKHMTDAILMNSMTRTLPNPQHVGQSYWVNNSVRAVDGNVSHESSATLKGPLTKMS
jgi:hypothetical protein